MVRQLMGTLAALALGLFSSQALADSYAEDRALIENMSNDCDLDANALYKPIAQFCQPLSAGVLSAQPVATTDRVASES